MSLEDKLIQQNKTIEESRKRWEEEVQLRNQKWEEEDRIREEKDKERELKLDKQLKDTMAELKDSVDGFYNNTMDNLDKLDDKIDNIDSINKHFKLDKTMKSCDEINMVLKWLCISTISAYVILIIKVICK